MATSEVYHSKAALITLLLSYALIAVTKQFKEERVYFGKCEGLIHHGMECEAAGYYHLGWIFYLS